MIKTSRTFVGCMVFSLELLIGLMIVSNAPALFSPFAAGVYMSFAGGIAALAAALAGKGSVEHLAAGTGVKGAIAALMTEVKPGEQTTKV